MIKKILYSLIIYLIIINPLTCNSQDISEDIPLKIPVILVINEKLPENIEGKAILELSEFLEENNLEVLFFPEELKDELNELIEEFMNNGDGKLAIIAKEEGALFLICGKLQAMERGTEQIYDKTLIKIEVFGEIKLLDLSQEKRPVNFEFQEKGLSVQIQESYQQALGKAIESIQKSIISEFNI